MITKMLAFVSVLIPLSASASTVTAKPEQGKLEFHAVGRPSMIKINGEGPGPAGTLTVKENKVTGDLTFDMTKISSGISMRDEHMKEKYLEVQKYPDSKLHVSELVLPGDFAAKGAKQVPFKGDLTLHGVTKPMEGKLDLSPGVDAVATFTVHMPDFNITIPTYLGITVKDDVPVELTMKGLKVVE